MPRKNSSPCFGTKYHILGHLHRSTASVERSDSLQALGPSLSLKNTTGLFGTVDSGQLAVDWGINAALLFGLQKVEVSHQSPAMNFAKAAVYHVYPAARRSRSRMVTVPNVGGFAGLSYRFPTAKISAGYRADFFFWKRRTAGWRHARPSTLAFTAPMPPSA